MIGLWEVFWGYGEISIIISLCDKLISYGCFIYDSSHECAGFFNAFKMTYPESFCHSERAFVRGRIPTVSAGSA